MGQTTPNLSIYIPSAGETNYEQSFAAGMMNIDQHDHSGGPNKGVPITNSGLADFSVTYDKLNANVVDPTTGIGTQGGAFQNRLQLLGYLANLYQLSLTPGVGFVVMNGGVSNVRTFQNSSSITWTNANGTGNPSADVNIGGISPVTVPNGGTGLTSLSAYAVLAGGTTSTANVQQVSGLGTLNQYLGSNGPGALPDWKTLPVTPQVVLQATVTMSASQFTNLSGTPIQIVAPQGAGTVIVPYTAMGKVNVVGSPFGSGSSVRFYYGPTSIETNVRFDSGTFDSSDSGYYLPTFQVPSTSVIESVDIENQGIYISVNSSNFSGGGTSTVIITLFYSVISI